jgi:cation/acetate symporter
LRAATAALRSIAIAVGIAFKNENVAFMIGLAFSIAASSNLPILLLSTMWKGTTTRGAVMGGAVGLASSLAGVVFSPVVWVAVLGHPVGSALFP